MATNQTPLYEDSLKAGSRMVNFAGWQMPVQFTGLIHEHQAVRKEVGIFDISHMGILLLEGNNPKDALQSLVPTDLNRIGPNESIYTVLLNEKGGIIDDLIIYDLGVNNNNIENILLIVNAASTESDKNWIEKHLFPKNISIKDIKENKILIAIQGPKTIEILQEFIDISLKLIPPFGHRQVQIQNLELTTSESMFIAHTGYTGEQGFELLLSADTGKALWRKLIQKGVTPCGLGARDTLRLEAGMHLYGNDINSETTPFEAGLGWLVHLEMPSNFIGRRALEKQAQEGVKNRLVGLKMQGRAIARHGYKVIHNGHPIGQITSGSWSPTLNKAIALAYVPIEYSKIGSILTILIRGTEYPATVVKRPFYKRKRESLSSSKEH